MGYFTRLYRLLNQGYRELQEDFLTEIFAEALQDEALLKSFCVTFLQLDIESLEQAKVTTQLTFPKLPGHTTDSRPDCVIEFRRKSGKAVIFIESKLGSGEGQDQLARYAEHLAFFKSRGYETYLLYLTQYFDPKEERTIFAKGVTARFLAYRWYQVYEWLNRHRDVYTCKVLEYMEEMQLNESRTFAPQDIYALQQMNRLQSMLDETFDGIVDETMSSLFGRPIGWSNRNVQLRDFNRYFKGSEQGNMIWVHCGFEFTKDDYPRAAVRLEVGPGSAKRKEVVAAMEWFLAGHPEWNGEHIDSQQYWAKITVRRSMLHFLDEADHIAAMEKFFVEQLTALHEIKLQYPDLGWKPIS